ncbi:MAG: right-handed parallel beta-helix repeat-containing protein [Lentisphaerae bacterium]|nr:right-handed parallel beta-helix repeat-containing protein [Lentisphaerota bacterium]
MAASGQMRAGGVGMRVLVLVGSVLFGLVRAGHAGVRYVDAAVAGGAANGSSWANAYSAMATALTAASSGDELWVARGTYAGAVTLQLKPGVVVYGGFANTMTSLAARDWNANPTLLTGLGIRRVLLGTTNAVLDGFVVTNGLAAGQAGGGLLSSGPGMSVRNCLFVNNQASGGTGYGGALAQTGAGSEIAISNCVFRDNSAAFGGAVYWAAGSTTVSVCRFIGNSATSGGGALYPLALTGTIADSVFLGNSAAASGGGAVYSGSRANCLALFQRCVFVHNVASGANGWGGAFVGADAYTLEDCVFSGNRTASWAGAIFGADNETVIRRCVFAGNEALNGGGATYYQGTTVFPSYENCLFAGNVTAGPGGALYFYSNARFTLRHSTLAGNRSGTQGGAIYHIGGTAFFGITNCVVWTNMASGGGAQVYANQAGTVGLSYSDVQGGWSGPGIQNLDADPLFSGGPAGTWTLVGPFLPGTAQTMLTASGAGWAVNAYRGLTVNPDLSQDLQFAIASNSTDTLYVWGHALTNRVGASIAQAGDAFQIQNYRPQILSPVIDAGVNVGVTNDLTDTVRPLNEGFEMGAYEVTVPTVTYTLQTSPAGLAVQADATTSAAPRALVWKTNSVHTIAVSSPLAGGAGTQFLFSAWSDGGAQVHSVTGLINGTTLTAAFSTQMLWTTAVEPVASAGTVMPPGGVWYELSAAVGAEAVAASGWVFTNWAGTVTGTNPQAGVTMNQAHHGIAQFAPTGTVVRVYSTPAGRDIDVDGTTWTTNMFSWQPGDVHSVSVAPTQDVGSVRYVFIRWEDGSTATQRLFTTGTAGTNLVAQFKTQYALTWTVWPDAGFGSVLPSSGTYLDAGTMAALTAVPATDVPFGRWTGAATGTNTTTSVLMNAPKGVTASFYHGQAGQVIYVNDNATGANTGLDWFNARVDLAQALAQAVSGDEIWVAQGTYAGGATYPMKPGVNLYGGFGGWEGTPAARDWNAHPSLLDGQGVRRVISATNNAALDGFVITNGASAGNGGGMVVDGVAAVIRNCTFDNNTAVNYGGALTELGVGSQVTISNCIFRNNSASYGGALHWASGLVAIRDSVFAGNRASAGGGVAYGASVSGLVERCTFVGNTAGSSGGGVYWTQSRLTCLVTNRHCVFADNAATGTGGAFVNVDSFAFDDCVISGNRSASYGGASFSADSSTTFRRSRFAGNESGHPSYGGSAMFYQGATGIPEFENCLLVGNESAGPGGALNAYSTASFNIRHCTIAANRTSATGGGLACGNGAVQVVNSILWNNVAAGGGAEIAESTPGSTAVLFSDVRGGRSGTGNIDADPQFEGGPGGVWTGAPVYDAARGQTALTDSQAAWAAGLLAGRFLNPNTNQYLQFVIASNSAQTVYVWGNAVSNRAAQAVATNGAAYGIAGYQPTSGSPVFDAGVDFGVTDDIRGAARPQPVGGSFDMGAYEGAPVYAVAFQTSASYVSESAGTAVVGVAVGNWLYEGTGTVQVAVTGGTAAAGTDFTFTPAVLTFDAATGQQVVNVTVLPNGAPNAPRTIVLTLSNPTNVTLGPIATHTITILDDDAPVTVSFQQASSSGMENVTPVMVAVVLNRLSAAPVSVQFSATGGTATPAVDYGLTPGTLTFAVGETTRQIALKVFDDALAEDAETVSVDLYAPVGASLGGTSRHTYTILDDNRKYVDELASGANNGSSWADAYANVASAMAHAHSGDEIWVAWATYPGPVVFSNGVSLYGGFTAGMSQLAERDWVTYKTTLSGGGRVVTGAAEARIDGFTITGGSSDYGGGMQVVGGAMVIANCEFRGNSASGAGAGLHLGNSASVVEHCHFINNGGVAAGGGGLNVTGLPAPTIRNCVFAGNTTVNYDGAGLQISGAPGTQVLNCTITGNTAKRQGGGIQVYDASAQAPVILRNCILWDNHTLQANDGGGSEICVQNGGRMTLSYSDVDQGTPWLYERGGGVLTQLAGILSADPLFANSAGGDFHLKSASGRWTPAGIVIDEVTSPCIDAGDPADPCGDLLGDPCPVDMGAYGGTVQAGGRGPLPPSGLFIIVK